MYRHKLKLGLLAGLAGSTALVHASLTSSYQFNGEGNWSIDAIGSNLTPVGSVDASVPAGSAIEKAFLYSAQTPFQDPFVPSINFDGTVYSDGAWTFLGENDVGLSAYRADVTAQVAAKVGAGGGTFSFSVTELTGNSATDGEVLAVVYSNSGEAERTIAFLDGFSNTSSDSTTINFADPLTDVGDPGFEALISLGIGFSHQPSFPSQVSIIDGNGRRLTSSAGGEDDGAVINGGLITAGGLGDSTANPDPFAGATSARTDDELYDLGQGNSADSNPFLANGDTAYTFDTTNPSGDDNIFFMGVNVTARAGVNEPPPPPPPNGVPDTGSSALLLGVGMLGLVAAKKRMAR